MQAAMASRRRFIYIGLAHRGWRNLRTWDVEPTETSSRLNLSAGLIIYVQYFSLIIKQHQPTYQLQKPYAEQLKQILVEIDVEWDEHSAQHRGGRAMMQSTMAMGMQVQHDECKNHLI